jgi:hypothetical protein
VPSAIRHDHELSSKGLVSILVEAQGADEAKLEGFIWKTFPDNDFFACVGTHVPIPESKGIPHGAVIGVDGKLLWAGSPLSDPKKISELIEAELAKVKKGWGDTPEAKKVRVALYDKGDLFAANAIVTAMAEGDARTALQAEVDTKYAVRKKAIANLQEGGRWIEAQAASKSLLKNVGTKAEWVAEVTPLLAEFDSEAGKAEIALEKKFEKIEKALRDRKGDNAVKQIQAMLKTAGDGKVAARIQKTLKALETPLKS